jgi:hypothetical protein
MLGIILFLLALLAVFIIFALIVIQTLIPVIFITFSCIFAIVLVNYLVEVEHVTLKRSLTAGIVVLGLVGNISYCSNTDDESGFVHSWSRGKINVENGMNGCINSDEKKIKCKNPDYSAIRRNGVLTRGCPCEVNSDCYEEEGQRCMTRTTMILNKHKKVESYCMDGIDIQNLPRNSGYKEVK